MRIVKEEPADDEQALNVQPPHERPETLRLQRSDEAGPSKKRPTAVKRPTNYMMSDEAKEKRRRLSTPVESEDSDESDHSASPKIVGKGKSKADGPARSGRHPKRARADDDRPSIDTPDNRPSADTPVSEIYEFSYLHRSHLSDRYARGVYCGGRSTLV